MSMTDPRLSLAAILLAVALSDCIIRPIEPPL
jgi:hypothetical protein